jgi:hypothetical protein
MVSNIHLICAVETIFPVRNLNVKNSIPYTGKDKIEPARPKRKTNPSSWIPILKSPRLKPFFNHKQNGATKNRAVSQTFIGYRRWASPRDRWPSLCEFWLPIKAKRTNPEFLVGSG